MKPKYETVHRLKENVDVVELWGKQVIKPADKIVYIPYFKERGQILMKWRDIPAFQMKYEMIDKWISIGKHDMVDGDPNAALRAGLMEDFGIELVDSYEPEILSPIFLSDDSCQEYYICIVSLMDDECTVSQATSPVPTVALSYSELNNYTVYDLITRYTLDLFRSAYSLF